MKIVKGVTLVTAGVLALAAQGGAAGGVTTSNYTVPSTTDEPGLNTGLVLNKGSVIVTASGSVCYIGSLCVDPDGDSAINTSSPGFVLPGASGIALLARVGDRPWVEVGSGPKKLFGKGELVLAINDIYFPDNTGSFEVIVSYKTSGVSRTCWPGWGWGDDNHEHCGPPGLANRPEQGSSNEHGKSEEKGNPKK